MLPMINTIGSLPPSIKQHFRKELLTVYIGPENHSKHYYKYIKKRYKANSLRMKECENLIDLYKDLYEWFEKKKAIKDRKIKEEAQECIKLIERINNFYGSFPKKLLKIISNDDYGIKFDIPNR